MADSITTVTTVSTVPSGTIIATDDAGASGHVQITKLAQSADGSATPITADANGLEIQGAGTAGAPAGGVVSVQGVASGTALPVSDNSGSLTVDAPVATPVFVRLSDGSAAISTLPVSAASLPLPSGAATESTLSALNTKVATAKTADYDSGVGTDTVEMVGIALPASGGAVAGGTSTNPIRTDPTGTTTQPVSAASLPLPSGAATLAEQQTQTTALQLLDDTVYTDGTGTPSKAIGVAGTDGTNPQILKTDTAGELQVDVLTLPNVTIGAAIPAGTNNIGDVDVLTVPAPLSTTGGGTEATALRVTLASDSTGVVSVDDNGGSLTVDGTVAVTNAGTFPVQVDGAALTALQLIDDVVKVEDDPHVTGDKGVMALAVRKDTGAALAGLDADYSPLQVDASGNLRVNVAAGGAGDGAILDGVSSSIKATVLDYTNSNPLAVRLTDTNGDYVGAGAGTQYTEDAAAAADPIGTQIISRRRDTLSATEVSLDGDVIAVNATNKGELYVKHVDAIPVTDNSGSLTVDNAALSVTGGGVEASALRVTLANDSTGVLSVDDNGGSLTVDAASLPLPTGAATLAEQQTQTTALQLIDDTVATDGAAAPTKGLMLAGTDGTNAQTVKVDTAGELQVDVLTLPALVAGTANIGDVDVLTVPAPLSTTGGGTEATALRVTVASDSTGVLSVDDNAGSLTVDNGGTFAVQVDGAALTALQKIDDPVLVDDAAFTPATSSVMVAGFQADETATDSVDEGDAGAARMTLDRKVIVTPQPHTAGGLSIFRSLDLDETEEDVKTSAGQVYGCWFTNTATSTRWLKFYNATAATVVVGTTTPVITLALPGNSSDDISGVFSSTHGIAFDTAICVAATTGVADADTGAPAANDVVVNIFYR